MFESYSDIVTVKELCVMLKIGRNTAYELVRSGRISSIRVGRQVRVSKESILSYMSRDIQTHE